MEASGLSSLEMVVAPHKDVAGVKTNSAYPCRPMCTSRMVIS